MDFKKLILPVLFLSTTILLSQSVSYEVNKAPFCSDKYDEFAPVLYKDGVVFCANKGSEGVLNYSDNNASRRYNILSIPLKDINRKNGASLFAKGLKSNYNDGPVSFNGEGDIVYFSRNVVTKSSKKSASKNKLGIYSASLNKGKWENIRETRYVNESYSVTTPCLSPNGKRLYFSSDMPGGYGGSDLYYCELINGFLGKPYNLGAVVNSEGNESFPYINGFGELFFSSDGHPGHGGKDIFVTKQKEDGWYNPIALQQPINSEFNDFGIVADSTLSDGFFSSDRDGNYDIFKFTTLNHPVWFSEPQLAHNYCVSLSETPLNPEDSLSLTYEWEVENGNKLYGNVVKYCYDAPGTYKVKVNLVDKATRQFYYRTKILEVNIDSQERPYINSLDYAIAGEDIVFDSKLSYNPGYRLENHSWDTGDGRLLKGEVVTHAFDQPGEYIVQLGIIAKELQGYTAKKMAVSKKIKIFLNEEEKEAYLKNIENSIDELDQSNLISIATIYDDHDSSDDKTVYKLQVLSSLSKLSPGNKQFGKITDKYSVEEVYDEKEGVYRYFVGENNDIISLYPSFKELSLIGYDKVSIRKEQLSHPAEIELSKLINRYGLALDDYFNSSNIMKSTGLMMTRYLTDILQKYPSVDLQIVVHTDNTISSNRNRIFSQYLGNRYVNSIAAKGIARYRLVSKGLGDALPIRSNQTKEGRMKNRRMEFKLIINE